jgi:ABC-type sugar transport system ATPase subunit
MRVQMRTEIIKLHQRLQATMIYVTHDQIEAITIGDRILPGAGQSFRGRVSRKSGL